MTPLDRVEQAAECCGCGAITELVQDSDYCWDCTYEEPPCLCAGAGWCTTADRLEEASLDQ
jgi:hypothetical protein